MISFSEVAIQLFFMPTSNRPFTVENGIMTSVYDRKMNFNVKKIDKVQ